ncbi:hypothetical protein KP509_23G051900 [Ceratopteris richardii]|uniref:Uncharacterized protein n=1 Tax=Ceratopteris richardii TaxID=49495 RepID=A0A8T2RZQ5_CERRI|nr:hypothetical protein KP509_23G051900 [Ceratopteris richardii]
MPATTSATADFRVSVRRTQQTHSLVKGTLTSLTTVTIATIDSVAITATVISRAALLYSSSPFRRLRNANAKWAAREASIRPEMAAFSSWPLRYVNDLRQGYRSLPWCSHKLSVYIYPQ